MILGVGIDVVDTERWARSLRRIQHEIFTPQELADCADRVDRVDALAARFAAKEACLKALDIGIRGGALRQIEIVSGPGGAPRIRLGGALATRARKAFVHRAHVSLTHEGGIAAAVVILEGTRLPARGGGREFETTSTASRAW
jgi:holo-[acyl-carrier protein] synthase